ncbi:CoA transferase subunit A [Natrarchaeobius halalkaliphilus]|uniref:CoA transferase subunit A n=1 Tax=Natrarchaeobius halalkaliphilus TaxID=1679091 RepID=A0A3N6M5B4_9EURY|nr:CoA-transferase [Natrarchaeobius halalkaliphilus]RQG87909.1 CoA transferase subunit A [Natrarchaeobius halalkaliphilus]
MPRDRSTTLTDAVERIEPGSSIAMGLALEHAIPFAVGHELVRQQRDELTLVGPISDVLFDQLVGAGLVDRIRAAWIGNASAGSGYCFRRAVESSDLEVEDHSNLSLAMALHAGSLGVSYLPTRSLLGSDLLSSESPFETETCPFTGETQVLVPAIKPDWTVVHAQRADRYGDVHYWGSRGVTEEAIGAADHVLVTCEELVEPSVIKSDPDRVVGTREQVDAVVECPMGAHPSPLTGCYRRDHDRYVSYHDRTETPEGYREWADEWVHGVDREEYVDRLDPDLRDLEETVAAEVHYGY